jgi:hypothetical protein
MILEIKPERGQPDGAPREIEPDTDLVLTRSERVAALDALSKPLASQPESLPFNPDDYPLF